MSNWLLAQSGYVCSVCRSRDIVMDLVTSVATCHACGAASKEYLRPGAEPKHPVGMGQGMTRPNGTSA